LGTDHDSAGRVDAALLAGLVENADAHYFLCGPTRFMADLQTGLEQRGIPAAQIHSETFGPVG
jgi:ferredoxin-NADP reductase